MVAAAWMIGISILLAKAEGNGEKAQLAVVTKRVVRRGSVPEFRHVDDDGESEEEADPMVEYNIAAFGKDYRLQFSKNKKLLRDGFRMEWKQ